MLRTLVVAAILALAGPVAASPALVREADVGVPMATDVPVGNPLLRVDPAFWLPILREEGYAGAARAADQPEPEETEAEEDEGKVEHWFFPLGDANGNGRDDVILATEEGEKVTYQALDGGRIGEVLWTFTNGDEDSYAYLAGDIDEDGVYDLEQMSDLESTGDDSGMQWEQRASVSMLSGRDLSPLTSLQVRTRGDYEETQPGPVPVGTSTYRESYTFEFLQDVDGLPGLARMAYNFEYYRSEDRVVVITTDSRSSMNSSTSFTLLDVAGALVWSFDEAGFEVDYGSMDVNADEVPDVLVRSNDMYEFAYGGFGPQPPVEPPVPIPFLTREEQARPPYQLKLLDGATGAVQWERTFGNATYSYTQWLGDLYGEGDVLAVYIFDLDMDTYESTQTLAFLDGDTGEVVKEVDGLRDYMPLGDADRSGRDDLLALDFNDSTLTFEAMDGEFSGLWQKRLAGDDFAGLLDVTGDAVVDLLGWAGDNLTVYSGTDGEATWIFGDARMKDIGVAPGIVDAADRELTVLLSDAKDHEDVADYPADLLVLRGDDGAPLWRKPLYDPTDYTDVAGDDAYVWVGRAGDLNGDGATDFIVEFEQGYTISISTSCVDDECETTREDSRDEDTGQPLNIVALVDGATGATIARYDDMELSGKIRKVEEAPTDVEAAAEDLVQENAPGFAFFAALAAVGLAFVLRRRKA